MNLILNILLYLILAPLCGGILSGLDRKITARMQSRIGPPVFQPFFDVLKLLQKENLVVRRSQNFYIGFFLVLVVFTGALFFTGKDILLVIFALTLAAIFFVLAGFKASSPYSFIGAQRELLQMMAYEPIIILSAVGMYMVTHSFTVADIISFDRPLVYYLPGILFGLLYILAMKFRKSPFDLSTSHHVHQELVKGITTEFSGKALAMIEVAHWFENMLVLGFIYIFFASFPVFGVVLSLAAYFLVILIDNTFARVKWQLALLSCWMVALIFGFGNILILFILPKST
ncbi:MAG: NADH-quinone oxidoreductase subunit H [Candidatus Omnitrophica bacterium]|nr:NADH-quinone oxidoreductase subunit H [Candidatus Omnitrophota bacterium]